MQRTVSEVAAAAGVTVRTLHHYDEIGLLRPSDRTEAGYRLYDDAALVRLHGIVLWRSLGFPLDEVRALLDDPAHDPLEALELHRARLEAEVGALHARIAALDRAIGKVRAGGALGEPDLVALFEGFDPTEFEEETEATWGHTEAFREARARTARYGPAQWRALKTEGDAVNARLAELAQRGVPPDAPEARVAVEAHRAHISRWFYDCTPEIHRGLAELYASDPRFQRTYERLAPGLAAWLTEAIRALHAPRPRSL